MALTMMRTDPEPHTKGFKAMAAANAERIHSATA